jgi:ATP phosphoribosyltransferase regulatory subunit
MNTKNIRNARLLPSGLYDLLPPDSRKRRIIVNSLLDSFADNGFDEVSPPLLEFEDSLLSGKGKKAEKRTFRVLDPESQKMMAFRTDITMQIARIATSRLKPSAKSPLKLCYAGEVLWVKGNHLRGERQQTQVGAEIIGSDDVKSDFETINLALLALDKLGIENLTLDINLPTLASDILGKSKMDSKKRDAVSKALSSKDKYKLAELEFENRDLAMQLIDIFGSYDSVQAKLNKLKLPGKTPVYLERLAVLVEKLKNSHKNLSITFDPLESRGFDYHTGVSYSILTRSSVEEIARGGRYEIPINKEEFLPATGFTLYVNTLARLIN